MMGTAVAPLTLIIIVFTAYASIQGFRQPNIVEKYHFSTEHIFQRREYYRIFTSALVHADWVHLLFNMFSFYSFGSFVERRLPWGSLILSAIYLSSIFGGSLLSLFLHRHHNYRSLGASGGVCGVIFACIFLFPGTQISFFLIPMPASLFAILFLGVSFWGLRSQRSRIGHDAHLGGALIGLLVTTLLYPDIVTQSPMLYLGVIGISVILFIYLYIFPPGEFRSKPSHHEQERYIQADTSPTPKKSPRRQRREDRERHDKETMNRLLDKISTSGMESLTEFERKQLEHISRRMRGPKH